MSDNLCIFSIAYGKSHIDKLFDRCVPSLITAGNLGRFERENVSIVIGTLGGDREYIRERFSASEITNFVRNMDTLAIPESGLSAKHTNRMIQTILLRRIMAYFIKRGLVFFYAPSDCVFADGTIYNNWCLHKITGKIIASFNGRTREISQDNIRYLDIINTKNGVKKFFMENYSHEWAAWCSMDPCEIAGTRIGHAIYREADRAHIFCNMPAPSTGRFTPEDLQYFILDASMQAFDNSWQQKLARCNRLLVQTNLDMGMSIEPDPLNIDDARGIRQENLKNDFENWMSDAYKHANVDTPLDVTLRQRKFDDLLNMFCFSTTLD
jgi:hypothetical protein